MTDPKPPQLTETDADGVRLLVADNPPVNALGHDLRVALDAALARAEADPAVQAVVIAGAGRGFFAGADIREMDKGRQPPRIFHITARIAEMTKPVVAAIHGHALGGGLEIALACRGRVATPDATLGLPEVKLGIIPGAGGTQRLPRLIGIPAALDLISSGRTVSGSEALALGLVDRPADGDLVRSAMAVANALAHDKASLAAGRREDPLPEPSPDYFEAARAEARRRQPGMKAPLATIEAVELTTRLPLAEGLEAERAIYAGLVDDPSSRALRHLFFAERAAARVPGIGKDTAFRPIASAAVLGAGTMGVGIAASLADAGLPVRLLDSSAEAIERGKAGIARIYDSAVARGRLSADEARARSARIDAGVGGAADTAGCDLVIEAVVENLEVKKAVFAELDRAAAAHAVLATNTSTLDVDAIAAATARLQSVLGLHFFSPANVMRLVEVVRARETSAEALAAGLDLVRRIGKLPVVVGVCDGFVGNRMLAERTREAERLLHDGAPPTEVDAAMLAFGFPMGPFAAADLAGIDVNWRVRQSRGTPLEIADRLYAMGRYGQKTGKGYYRYEAGNRRPLPDPEVEALVAEVASRDANPAAGRPSAEEIVERLVFPLINAGARILAEGIAARPGDIDVIWVNGYGWPAAKGGPMHHADTVGLPRIVASLDALHARTGEVLLQPAPLLRRLAAEGRSFASLNVQKD